MLCFEIMQLLIYACVDIKGIVEISFPSWKCEEAIQSAAGVIQKNDKNSVKMSRI